MSLDIPSGFLTDVASSSSSMIASLGGVSALIFGILLAFLVIEMVISALQKKEPEGE